MAPHTHYDTLGVARTASMAEVRDAYRVAARHHHPDAGGDPQRMQAVNAAWRVLGHPVRRAAYDRALAGAGSGTTSGGSAGAVADEPVEGFAPDVAADLADDRPLRPTRGLEGWWAILPPATFLVSVALFVGAFVLSAPELLGLSLGTMMLAGGLFVLAPLRAMARRPE